MTTETLDKVYLEWSQFTAAKTSRELELQAKLAAAEARVEQLEESMLQGFPTHLRKMWSGTEVQNWLTKKVLEAVEQEPSHE